MLNILYIYVCYLHTIWLYAYMRTVCIDVWNIFTAYFENIHIDDSSSSMNMEISWGNADPHPILEVDQIDIIGILPGPSLLITVSPSGENY